MRPEPEILEFQKEIRRIRQQWSEKGEEIIERMPPLAAIRLRTHLEGIRHDMALLDALIDWMMGGEGKHKGWEEEGYTETNETMSNMVERIDVIFEAVLSVEKIEKGIPR